ncbi:MAG: TonB-dependent receptor [Melioribacteraceae bacterium]|nr:TonB-dependent receptor [Melioribacteraceae bacterium]MCF8355187.1 TonB-dependent receptor [Melioribacteraceae bacterium]MCF8395400.1 TonB-dependent receptor [Melioribacteraceae bacterium]MCF8419894.1 TonB-dependent receptor [Melioribacteraceae bacterium]
MKYLIILLLFLTSQLIAQIQGTVLSAEDNSPLVLANIFIEGTSTGTTTDQSGKFELHGDFTDNQILNISYIGYETRKLTIAEIKNKPLILLDKKLISSQTILVQSTIGVEGETPATFSKIKRKEIKENYAIEDIPEYLSYLPSTTFYSEGGMGLGYNYISIRGFDQRRISVSINGIPQNDPEDHNVYWLDMPDLLASTELIQVQRGAGSGVVGYPSIGGSINIVTSNFADKPSLELSSSFGSFNTRKYSASVTSGLVDNKYSFYAKFSQILSSGYRNYNWIDFKSYHLSAVRYDKDFTTQINIYGGPVSDGLVYNGLPKFAVKDKKLRRENYSYWEASDNSISYAVDRRPDELENFSQPHFELLNDWHISNDIQLNSALFLIIGKGFFDYDGSWSVFYDDYFRLRQNNFDTNYTPANALIRAMVENRQWGWIQRLSINHDNGKLIIGGEIRSHRSVHWGSINYAENLPPGVTKDYRYYYYEGGKDIYNFYLHEQYKFNERFNALAEVQFDYHRYEITNEKYLNNEFEISGMFVNPRIGLNYKFNEYLNIYLSYAMVSREPRLKTYYDAAESSAGETPQFKLNSNGKYNFDEPLVKPETMNGFDLGANYSKDEMDLSLNLFYMLFDDEIVKQGQVDRFGQPITGNISKTIHMGIEASSYLKIAQNFQLILNGSYSKNYVQEGVVFTEVLDGSNNPVIKPIDLKDNRISGFPNVTFNGILKFNYKGLVSQFITKYVGDFYSDNYDDRLAELNSAFPGLTDYIDNKVDAYFVANFFTSYEFGITGVFKKVKAFVQVDNIFDNLYASYAIGKEFFPAAERHFLAGIEVGL